jgi:hypothetical protein
MDVNCKKIDFLCVGFQKCGTTTLDAILRQYNQIYLPSIKEPIFESWYKKYKNPKAILYKRYFPDRESRWKKLGMVDTSLSNLSVKKLQNYFGTEIKIIIMLRNPVNALFSNFKMSVRNGQLDYYVENDDINNMFNKFLRDNSGFSNNGKIGRYKYSRYLKEIYNYYKRENIKIIIFENFVSTPQLYKPEIESFLELGGAEVDYMIKMNEGNRMVRNKYCFRINGLVMQFVGGRFNQFPTIRGIASVILDKISKYTLKEDNTKLSEILRRKCENYYREDVREIEKILNIDLSELWF